MKREMLANNNKVAVPCWKRKFLAPLGLESMSILSKWSFKAWTTFAGIRTVEQAVQNQVISRINFLTFFYIDSAYCIIYGNPKMTWRSLLIYCLSTKSVIHENINLSNFKLNIKILVLIRFWTFLWCVIN